MPLLCSALEDDVRNTPRRSEARAVMRRLKVFSYGRMEVMRNFHWSAAQSTNKTVLVLQVITRSVT